MPVDEPLYPVNLLLTGRSCLVVGGGRVAVGKVRGLVEAGAHVTVVAPEVDDRILAMAAVGAPDGGRGVVVVERRAYRRGEVAGHRLVIAATGDPAVNQRVYDDGEAAGVWVNSADDPERCSLILPARVRQGRLTVTVSTAGHSPAVASWLRARLADELGPEYDDLIGLLSEAREEVRAQGHSTEQLDWRAALDSGILDLVRAGRLEDAKERLRACLSSSSD
ncbi:MAG TPA: bifunctional precorrin-2 dehydrogenase/sirohydrochlorin ferrochelatase [Acidimicrobiales bacterium]|nr:bifunctional precorrin-2 dehydrogenase/sirohydrochlorin ferrochelatase [Acidimicrobiales bacterium]